MKKIIAGAALVATLVGSATPALANTDPVTTTTSAPAATATTNTEATATTVTETPATTATEAPATASTEAEVTAATELDAELESVTLTPDKLFYFLKLWVEKVQLTLTQDAAERAALLEQQAQTRLAEAVQMAEAGKADLAQQALAEAQAKLEAASAQIELAAKNGKSLDKVIARVEADQTRFAKAVTTIRLEVPAEVAEKLEPMTTDLLVQVAATQDAVTQDEAPVEEADKTAEEAGLKDELANLQPRMVLVLKSMADASGKDLSEVYAMYQQNPGLGRMAKHLGLKMGAVQHAAQIEWKKAKFETEIKAENAVQTAAPVEAQVELKVQPAAEEPVEHTTSKIQLKINPLGKITDGDDDEDEEKDDSKWSKRDSKWSKKEKDDEKSKHGKGRGNGRD